MRLNNRNKAAIYNFLSTALLFLMFLGVLFFFLEYYKFHFLGWKAYFLLIIPAFLNFVFYFRGRQIFEYDSDGEALNFKNRNVIPFVNKNISDEFPKYKLLKYEVINALFFKKLFITISSKKSGTSLLKYDISYLTKKEIFDLKFSLNKVVKANKEKKSAQNS